MSEATTFGLSDSTLRPTRRMMLAIGVVCLASALCVPASVQAREGRRPPRDRFTEAGTSVAEVEPFLSTLQKAVAGDDRRAVARLFFFPSKVWDGRSTVTAMRRADIVDRYDSIFDRQLKQLIAAAAPDQLQVSWRGVALADERLWFARITTQERLAITMILGPDVARVKAL